MRGIVPIVVLAFTAGGPACAQQPPAQTTVSAPATADIPEVLATIDGSPVTLSDARARAGDAFDQLDMRYRRTRYQLVKAALDSILRERVLAAEAQTQGKTLDELVAAEAGGSLEPSEVEVSAWYSANQSRLSGRTLEQLRPQIVAMLSQQRRKDALQKLEERVYATRKVEVKLPPFRIEIDNRGAPARGPEGAPVTLVEFADFQCPYCRQFEPTMARAEREFGKNVKLIYRQMPLVNLHPYAFKAAEASLCANEQGKFWEMHDLLYQEGKLEVSDLKAAAGRLGLDQKKFDGCLDAGRSVERVQLDLKEASRLGINGTPAVFVNGAPLEGGAVPYETLAAAIREELARQAKK